MKRFQHTPALRIALSASLLVALGACSDGTTEDTATASDAYTLDNVCGVLAEGICSSRQTCCESTGVGYDAEGCEAHHTALCEANVEATRAGTMSFDPTHMDACLDALVARLQGDCIANKADMPNRIPELKLCHSIFMGQRQPGESCTSDEQCEEPVADNQVAFCDHEGSQTCFIFGASQQGESCEAGPGARTVCVSGLYCETDFAGAPPFAGICRAATTVGNACDAEAQPISFECGAGYFCDLSSQICQPGQPAGEPCTSGAACVSTVCSDGSCTEPDLMVDHEKCHGA